MLSEKRRLVYRKKTVADTLAANRQQLVRKIVYSNSKNRGEIAKNAQQRATIGLSLANGRTQFIESNGDTAVS